MEQVGIHTYVGVKVILDVAGLLDMSWPSMHGASGYGRFVADKGASIGGHWENFGFSTKVRHTGGGFERGKTYWFAV